MRKFTALARPFSTLCLFSAVGCGSNDKSPIQTSTGGVVAAGGAATFGGSSSGNGGSRVIGGNSATSSSIVPSGGTGPSATQATATGGNSNASASTSAGTSATGGLSAGGSSLGSGGNSGNLATGGVSASGGAPINGGTASVNGSTTAGGSTTTGGTALIGSTSSTGGSMNTGGNSSMSGGTTSAGGLSNTGGTTPTGGTTSTGGNIPTNSATTGGVWIETGGNSPTGGNTALGGTSSTGGTDSSTSGGISATSGGTTASSQGGSSAACADADGDGYSTCDGDCCDGPPCPNPERSNPGAFDVPGNGVDDDCNGTVDDVITCDNSLATNSADAMDYAHALDLCRSTTANAIPSAKTWGVLEAKLALADGTGTPHVDSRSIRPGFGFNIMPRVGGALAVLSTGHAASTANTNPSFAEFEPGQDMGTTSNVPSDWLAAHGGSVPSTPGCPAPQDTKANDPVMLTLRMRTPTNAHSFSVSAYFLSSEFPEWVCSPYNDVFVALLDSTYAGQPANPSDKNLAIYQSTLGDLPLGANLAVGNTGLFTACENGAIGCDSGAPGQISACTSTTELLGTGFDKIANQCDSTPSPIGGGTGWLRISGNIVPGEVMTLRLAIWDTGDHTYDSLVLLDGWTWSEQSVTPGTAF